MITDILNHLWQSTLVAVAAGLLVAAFRHNRACVRYTLWFGASLKFLLPFAALTALGSVVEWTPALAPIASVTASPGDP